MFGEIFRFECRHQSRAPLFAIVAAVFFLIGFFAMASESLSVGFSDSSVEGLKLNAAYVIVGTTYVFTIIGMFAGVAFVASPITRDYELRTAEVFVSSGVPRLHFLFGRFAGGFLFAFLAVSAAVLGTVVGSFAPWLDQERIAQFAASPYLFALWAVTLPNVFIPCCFFFAVAALSRSMVAAYVVVVALMVTSVVTGANTDQETLHVTALIDPFGLIAFSETTRYWTAFDRNALVPELAGAVLWNRLIWLAVALAALGVAAWRFRFEAGARRRKRREPRDVLAHTPGASAISSGRVGTTLAVRPRFDAWLGVRQFVSQVTIDVRGVLKSVPFYVLLLFGMSNVIGGFYSAMTQGFGTPVLPVTGMMLNTIAGAFIFVVMIIVIYYGADLMHRERDARLVDIVHASPVPTGVMVAAKIATLITIVVLLLTVVMVASIVVQALNGHYDFQISVYLFGLYVALGWTIYLLCAMSVVIQSLVRQKFVGMVVVLALFLLLQVIASFGFEHSLYQLGTPQAPYSDMNGFGHFVEPLLTIGGYWTLIVVLFVFVAHLFSDRGYVERFADRVRIARARLTPAVGTTMLVTALGAIALGGWIFYNTNILNPYLTQDDLEKAQADYEKKFKRLRDVRQPEVTDLEIAVDIFPEERRLESRGKARLVNIGDAPINELHLTLPPRLRVNALDIPGSRPEEEDLDLGYRHYVLEDPLLPGATRELAWDITWSNSGFVNARSNTRVVTNGTFVNNGEIMPQLGYVSDRELDDNNVRRKYELPPVERLPKYDAVGPDDPSQFEVRRRSGFRAVVSTSADQIAVAPGYLANEWTESGRRYFAYEMDAPIFPFVSFMSARYAVARDAWNDVAIEVFHHPTHDYNVERMIVATKKSLEYFTRELGPFQYRQFRILEFPRYETFAQSFPNTIPYSEAIGFVADLSDPKDIDFVFYVTAHELAHQWWGHQVVGVKAQGMTMLVETLAQYSALMVMEHEYGPTHMRRFLKYELDRYLSGRGGEQIEELPLARVEDQPYIHYAKGSVVMYALKDAIGEDAVNRALRRLIAEFGMKDTPYPRTGDLIAMFRAEAGEEHQALITDLFEKITLFDSSVKDAAAEELPDGTFRVTARIDTRELEADGEGREVEKPMDVVLDIAVFPERDETLGDNDLPQPLVLERRRFREGSTAVEFVVKQRPSQIGIDPYAKMIDRNPDDNLQSF